MIHVLTRTVSRRDNIALTETYDVIMMSYNVIN